MTYISVDVDLKEVYDNLYKTEKESLLQWLEEDGVLPETSKPSYNGLINKDFNEVCSKLSQSYYRMSKEDEETITKIMKKYN